MGKLGIVGNCCEVVVTLYAKIKKIKVLMV